MSKYNTARNAPVPVPVPESASANSSAIQVTLESKRILDQVLIRAMRLSVEDRTVLVLALQHTSRELALAADKVKAGRVPSELDGIPATLALMSAMTILVSKPEMQERFDAFVSELRKFA